MKTWIERGKRNNEREKDIERRREKENRKEKILWRRARKGKNRQKETKGKRLYVLNYSPLLMVDFKLNFIENGL